ncbi:hypothetical protein, partial [Komagataeibacter xylinus]|uniref:hypothetical protein n=1 Tax=Komagataeibacter xylinus TaxID=28448 RepID=UPI001C3F2D48
MRRAGRSGAFTYWLIFLLWLFILGLLAFGFSNLNHIPKGVFLDWCSCRDCDVNSTSNKLLLQGGKAAAYIPEGNAS